jgi:hypothetical protein
MTTYDAALAGDATEETSGPTPMNGSSTIPSTLLYMNQVWDPGAGGHLVQWQTATPDSTGMYYPNPYGSGFGACSGYNVIAITFS